MFCKKSKHRTVANKRIATTVSARFSLVLLIAGFAAQVNGSEDNSTFMTEKTPSEFVSTETSPAPQRYINKLQGFSNGVSSGFLEILDEQTIFIPNFRFDGNAPDTHFVLIFGPKVAGDGIRPLSINNKSEEALEAFNGQDVTVTFPADTNVHKAYWLSVWSGVQNKDLGHVMLKAPRRRQYPPQTFPLNLKVRSGPVVLVDKKTLYIPDLHFSGQYSDAHFWIGNGTEPSFQGILVPDEQNSNQSLKPYSGESIYLHLPDPYSTDNIQYFGVFSRKGEGENLGHVPIDRNLDAPLPNRNAGNITVLRIPKCCSQSEYLTTTGCADMVQFFDFRPAINVSDHNATHLNTDPISPTVLDFVPYYSPMECPSGFKYPLTESLDTFSLLKNGSLIVKGPINEIVSQGKFCVDFVDPNSSLVLLCVPEKPINQAVIVNLYLSFMFFSLFCYAGVFVTYYFYMDCEDIHKKCFCWYSLSMFVSFLMLILIQMASIEGQGCEVIGFLFQLSMISSYTWLCILSFDIFFMIYYFEDNMSHGKRIIWYYAIGFGLPLLSLVVSLIKNLTPDVPNSFFKPQYGMNSCSFEAENQRWIFFHVPIIVSLICSIIWLGWAKIKIVAMGNTMNAFWVEHRRSYTFMFRRYVVIAMTMTVWIIDSTIHLFVSSNGIMIVVDYLEAVQGAVVFVMFILSSYAKEQIQESIKTKKRKRMKRKNVKNDEVDEFLMGLK